MLQDENDGLLGIARELGEEPLDAVHRAGGSANTDHQRRLRLATAVSLRRLAGFIHACGFPLHPGHLP